MTQVTRNNSGKVRDPKRPNPISDSNPVQFPEVPFFRLLTPFSGKLFLQDHASPVWYRNIKIRPLADDPWSDPAFVWPDQTTGIALRPPGSKPAASGAMGGNWLRLAPGDPGRILIDLSPATRWELGLNDAGGRRLAGFRGVGPGSRTLGASALAPGTYFLTGKADGQMEADGKRDGRAGGRLLIRPHHAQSSP